MQTEVHPIPIVMETEARAYKEGFSVKICP